MGNLMADFNNKTIRKRIINSLFLHEYISPYDVERNNIVKEVSSSINTSKILALLSKNSYIEQIQKAEEHKMINMYTQLLAATSENEVTEDIILENARKFANLPSFDEKIRALNLAYYGFRKGNKISNSLIDEGGRVKWEDIQRAFGGEIKTIKNKDNKDTKIRILGKDEEAWFNAWYQIFRFNNNNFKNINNTKINLGPFSKDKINELKQNFLKYEEELEQKQKEYENQGDYLKSEMLKIIQEYTLGRGLNLIGTLSKQSKEKINFDNIKEDFANKSSESLSNKIKGISKPKNIHYNYKDIRGSFTTTISAENQKGFLAERVKEMIENLDFTIVGEFKEHNNFTWKAKQVGNITNESNKMQKIDNITIIPNLIEVKETNKGKEIVFNARPKNNIQIGSSLKDYRDADISLHSGGNLDSIREYLAQNINNINDKELLNLTSNYLKQLEEMKVKYLLLNEGEPNRVNYSRSNGFFKELSESISNLGPVFALSKISAENDLKGVDFLVINQVIIPGSYLFSTIIDIVKYHTTISPGTYPSGPQPQDKRVKSPDYTPEKITAKENYSNQLLETVKTRNYNLYSKIIFTMHLKKQFKNILINKVKSF